MADLASKCLLLYIRNELSILYIDQWSSLLLDMTLPSSPGVGFTWGEVWLGPPLIGSRNNFHVKPSILELFSYALFKEQVAPF